MKTKISFVISILLVLSVLSMGFSNIKPQCNKNNIYKKHCQTSIPTQTRTMTTTPTKTSILTVMPTQQSCWFYVKYTQVDTSLYQNNDVLSNVIVTVPSGSEVLYNSTNQCVVGNELIYVRAVVNWNGQTAELYDGWIRVLDLGQYRPGWKTPTPFTRCYDC